MSLGEGQFVQRDINVLALIKGREQFVYLYDDDSRADLIRHLCDLAASPDVPISWFDVNVLTQRVREQSETAPAKPFDHR